MKHHSSKNHNSDILVVDDDAGVRRMIKRILGRSGYNVRTAHGGQEAYASIAESLPDLIILDLSMPMIDGFEVATYLKSNPKTKEIPIILITGLDNSENHVKALDIGINDFLSKTAEPEEILARTRSHLRIKHLNDQLNDYRKSLEKTVDLRTTQLKDASLEVIWRLTAASECRDNETGTHIKRMSHYSAAIARKMGLAQKTVETILYSAPMHDIGKIGIPDHILLKPDKLAPEEWQVMKSHTIIGANILKGSKIGFVRMGAMIALTHHEKWDGSGYPSGLKGRQIPLAGRIVALADVFDALTSERPYKKAFSVNEANRIIEEGRQRHFDPDVLNAFAAIQDEILQIKEKFLDHQMDPIITMNPVIFDGSIESLFKDEASFQ
jgi:putative two-component system response regulator